MPLVKINGITHDFDQLGDEVKSHLKYLAFIDAELEQLGMRQNLLHMARDQVGQRMDRALMRDSINQLPAEALQSSDQPADSQA